MQGPGLNFDLGESIDMLRDAVHNFAQAEIAPLAAQADHDNVFPNALWPKLGDMGLLGITVEEEYGGSDMGYLAHVVAMEEISPRLGVDRAVLRRAFQPVREPDPQERHAKQKARNTCRN
jgi:isovaleryl-CoA dehydrogenase